MSRLIDWNALIGERYTKSNGAAAFVNRLDIQDMRDCEDWPQMCNTTECLFWDVCPKHPRRQHDRTYIREVFVP